MNIVDDPVETIHVYMVREEERAPILLPLFAALVCLAVIASVTIYSGAHPSYTHETLRIPARVLPLQTFKVALPVIPTGIKTYPATNAHGTLIITNGSVVSQELPAGLIFSSDQGTEVATDSSVFVPAGSAAGFGAVSVSAHSVVSGAKVNLLPLAIDAVYGTSLYIRNLEAFSGGRDAYSLRFAVPQDHLRAIEQARATLVQEVWGLHYPCKEQYSERVSTLPMTWECQFISYQVPSYMQVMRVTIQGKNLLVDVVFVARPTQRWVR